MRIEPLAFGLYTVAGSTQVDLCYEPTGHGAIINTAYFLKLENYNTGFRIIRIYHILCALWAVKALISAFSILNIILFIPFTLLLSLTGLNLLLLKGRKPYRLTIINQLLQIVQFQIGRFVFLYSAGVYLSLGMDAPDIGHVFVSVRSWTFTCLLRLNALEPAFYLAINIIPMLIILIVVLLKNYKRALEKDHPPIKLVT